MTDRKLDIFEAMAALDRRDGGWFASQPEDARKTLAAPVFLRWASAISDGPEAASLLLRVNDLVNRNMWDLAGDHAELVFRLAASCGKGRRERHQWVPLPRRSVTASKARALVASENPGLNELEIDLLLSMHTKASFTAWVDGRGLATAEAKETIKSYDKLSTRDQNQEPGSPKGKARGRGASS